jgi:thiol-disulfide isomerase/thioredoxin
MDKDRKTFVGIILLLLAFMIFVGILTFKDKNNQETISNSDAIIFKNEYESLNNVVREKDGKTIKELSIASDNPVDIVTEEEVIDILENGTGLIYMGFPDCPWCRSMLPVLLQTLDNVGIDKLYYINISSIRDTLTLNDKNKVEVEESGTDAYYKMLELMDDVLEPYYLTNSDGKKVDTKEKRILAPTIVAVKNGEIVGIHTGTVDSQTDPYEDLTIEQQEELSNIYLELIESVYDISCDEAC